MSSQVSSPKSTGLLTSDVPLLARRRLHPYNATTVEDQSFEVFTGTGYRLNDPLDIVTRSNDLRFNLPSGGARGDVAVLDYLQWFSVRYQAEFDSMALAEWNQTEVIFKAICSRRDDVQMGTVSRHLLIHAYPRAALPPGLQYVDVGTGIQCTAQGADLHLTGQPFSC